MFRAPWLVGRDRLQQAGQRDQVRGANEPDVPVWSDKTAAQAGGSHVRNMSKKGDAVSRWTRPADEIMSAKEAADALGVSIRRVKWMVLNKHLKTARTTDGSVGVTKESLATELAYRADAGPLRRIGRFLMYFVRWGF